MEVSYSSNGTLNSNIDVTTSGNFLSVSRDNNVTYNEGEAVIKTTKQVGGVLFSIVFLTAATKIKQPIFRIRLELRQ